MAISRGDRFAMCNCCMAFRLGLGNDVRHTKFAAVLTQRVASILYMEAGAVRTVRSVGRSTSKMQNSTLAAGPLLFTIAAPSLSF